MTESLRDLRVIFKRCGGHREARFSSGPVPYQNSCRVKSKPMKRPDGVSAFGYPRKLARVPARSATVTPGAVVKPNVNACLQIFF
jgi:hypothetical protein